VVRITGTVLGGPVSASTITTSSRSTAWYAYLVVDPWIAFSWLIFIFAGLMAVLMLTTPKPLEIGPRSVRTTTTSAAPANNPLRYQRPLTFATGLREFLYTGYIFWSLYFGGAACCRYLARSVLPRFASWAARGGLYVLLAGSLFIALGAAYSVLGGGVYQFAMRWWLVAHGYAPAFLGPPTRTEVVQGRLARIEHLWRSGAISRAEYDQQRHDTLAQL
jgi:hypothetical protein